MELHLLAQKSFHRMQWRIAVAHLQEVPHGYRIVEWQGFGCNTKPQPWLHFLCWRHRPGQPDHYDVLRLSSEAQQQLCAWESAGRSGQRR